MKFLDRIERFGDWAEAQSHKNLKASRAIAYALVILGLGELLGILAERYHISVESLNGAFFLLFLAVAYFVLRAAK